MGPQEFVRGVASLDFEHTFNPYSDRCVVHDAANAPKVRAAVLLALLTAAHKAEVDSIWIGRDLGYRGGRRTGLALTDDIHIRVHALRWGISADRPTRGEALAERTAAVIWTALSQIEAPVFLWNVFPLHPHEPGNPFSNRSHNSAERRAGQEMLFQLIQLLRPRRLIAIGNDAARALDRQARDRNVIQVRHPSYGGQTVFLKQIKEVYKSSDRFARHREKSA